MRMLTQTSLRSWCNDWPMAADGEVAGQGRDERPAASVTPRPITVVGAGSIGVAWAVVFSRAGREVRLCEVNEGRRRRALDAVSDRLGELAAAGLLEEAPATVTRRVSVHADLTAAIGAGYVQECVPEDLRLKRAIFAELERRAGSDAVLASSSSALTPSQIFDDLTSRERCLVAHPANPPDILPLVEIVPGPFTAATAVTFAEQLFHDSGMSPVTLRQEIEGFVYNRLQGAVLREAYCLVRDGIADVDDVDRVVREGLGRRWSIIGPFETVDLNTRGGIAEHARLLGPAYARMGALRGQDDPWTPELVARVAAQRRALLPLAEWEPRTRWRDRALIAAERARRHLALASQPDELTADPAPRGGPHG